MGLPSVLVTGGAVRIGAAICERFAEAGWHVVIHHRTSHQEAEKLIASLPSAEAVICDLSDGDAAVSMIKELSAQLSDWRVLINSASVFDYDGFAELDPDTAATAMQVNALTPARMAQTFLASAKSPAGRRVIQVTDQKLENTNPDFFSYTMSKHAVDATIGMLASGHKASGHKDSNNRIYGLAPGAILASHDQSEDETELSHRLNPLARKTGADEIAEAAYFLATGNLRSGETIFVDSGQHLLDQDRDVIYLAREMAQAS